MGSATVRLRQKPMKGATPTEASRLLGSSTVAGLVLPAVLLLEAACNPPSGLLGNLLWLGVCLSPCKAQCLL